jgi:hypothetical protein
MVNRVRRFSTLKIYSPLARCEGPGLSCLRSNSPCASLGRSGTTIPTKRSGGLSIVSIIEQRGSTLTSVLSQRCRSESDPSLVALADRSGTGSLPSNSDAFEAGGYLIPADAPLKTSAFFCRDGRTEDWRLS